MNYLRTATGREFESDYLTASESDRTMYLFVKNITIAHAAAVFGSPGETSTIAYEGKSYYGYTKLQSLSQTDNSIRVCLIKE